jgi:hypothetical protein
MLSFVLQSGPKFRTNLLHSEDAYDGRLAFTWSDHPGNCRGLG